MAILFILNYSRERSFCHRTAMGIEHMDTNQIVIIWRNIWYDGRLEYRLDENIKMKYFDF